MSIDDVDWPDGPEIVLPVPWRVLSEHFGEDPPGWIRTAPATKPWCPHRLMFGDVDLGMWVITEVAAQHSVGDIVYVASLRRTGD